METVLKILKVFNDSKNYKKLAWIMIVIFLLIILLFPIIDANFLYPKRVSNRVDVLEKITKIDAEVLEKNDILINEYNSILEEMSSNENNYINNVLIYKESIVNNIIKILSGAWLFLIVGIILFVRKDNKSIVGGIFSILIAILLGYFAYSIPTIVNVTINVIIYQIILIYLAYTISRFSESQKKTYLQSQWCTKSFFFYLTNL